MKNGILYLALLVLGCTWGLTVPLSKIVVSTGYSPLGVVFWQSLYASIILALAALIFRLRIEWTLRMMGHFLTIGLLGSLLPGLAFYIAAVKLPGGFLAIIVAAAPMFSLLMALALRLESYSPLRLFGVALGAVSIFILMVPDATLPDWLLVPFILIALLAPLFYAAEANYLTTLAPKNVHPVITLLGASVVATLVSGPLAWGGDLWVNIIIPWDTPEWALLFMSAISAFAYVGYVALVGLAGAVFAIQTAYVVTIAGVILSAIILDESYTSLVWLALLIMLSGLVMVRPQEISKN